MAKKFKKAGIIISGILFLFFYCGQSALKVNADDSWSNVGSAGFSSDKADNTQMLFNPSTHEPYVCYVNIDADENASVVVQKYNGSSWQEIGSAIPISINHDFSCAFNPVTNAPYVAFTSQGTSVQVFTVERFSGGSWEQVGSTNPIQISEASGISLAFNPSTGDPYVAYETVIDENYVLTVSKFDGSGWVSVGDPIEDIASGDAVAKLVFNPSTDKPYVAYVLFPDSDIDQLIVKEFNGTVWQNVGNPGLNSGTVGFVSAAFDSSSEMYVAYSDYDSSPGDLVVKKFNGTSWANVGTAGAISSGNVENGSIVFNPSDGNPYVAFSDDTNQKKMTVVKFDGSNWSAVGSAGFSAGQADGTSLAFNPSNNEPYVVYSDYANNLKATVMGYDSTSSSSSSSHNSSSHHKKKTPPPPKRKTYDSASKIARGQILTQSGKRFTKNSDVALYFTRPDGTYYPPMTVHTTSSGSFSVSYHVTKPAGTYHWYVVDLKNLNKKSKTLSYSVH
ncbi:MAG: hypothetical protein P4L62_00065 [Candidatus Pacebacteria bacterium]|nr:hypothetical protein [Candidatus Paceibacterota bacterium]